MTRPETVEALAEFIWNTSRADEGTISATGAKHVAAILLNAIDAGQVPGLVTSEAIRKVKREALTEAAARVLNEVWRFEVGCEADVGYYDAHMEIAKMLRDRAEQAGGR